MRINADIQIVLRASANTNWKKRVTHGTLAIGRKNEDEGYFMLVCTNANKAGTKYLINKINVIQIFTKFVNDGKCTFRFKDPHHDICVHKCHPDPSRLKSFLTLIKNIVVGNKVNLSNELSALSPASNAQLTKPKTKLLINQKKDYPISSSFPASLEVLKINELNLRRVDSRILKLKYLKVLDLSGNSIRSIPADWDELIFLSELDLSFNSLTELPPQFCQGKLTSSLKLLNLKSNKFECLPRYICNLRQLSSLKLDDNKINSLPPSLGKMNAMNIFTASNNAISFLPGSILHWKLELIDLTGNPLHWNERGIPITSFIDFPTLLSLSAKTVLKSRFKIPFIGYIPLTLSSYLLSCQTCRCGELTFDFAQVFAPLDLKRISAQIQTDSSSPPGVMARLSLCSLKCLNIFKDNPFAYLP